MPLCDSSAALVNPMDGRTNASDDRILESEIMVMGFLEKGLDDPFLHPG